MKVIVGSQNPVKINAVKRAFKSYFDDFEIEGVKVDSGVSDQPMNEKESYQGALNRAQIVMDNYHCDYAVGLEGGLEELSFGTTTCGFIVILSKEGIKGVGTSARMVLPSHYVSKLKNGEVELGDLISKDAGEENYKQKGGMFGLYSKGVVPREDAYFQGVIFALSRIISSHFYK